MKNTIDCDFKTSRQIDSGMQSTSVVDNKIVSETRLNVIDTTRSAVDAKFGDQIDITTQVESAVNRLSVQIEADTDRKIHESEIRINQNVENRLNVFEQEYDTKIENRLNLFEIHVDAEIDENVNEKLDDFKDEVIEDVNEDVDERLNIFESTINQKFVPQRLNVFGTMDISGQTITPEKAYTYVDVKLPAGQYQSTKVDLADIIQTKVITEDINPDPTMRSYDYIFTKLVTEGDH